MLYRTHHHPFFFPFNPFTSFPPTTTTPRFPLSSPPSIQGMECVEGALKSNLRPEMALKPTQQAFLDDVWTVTGQSGISGDDLFVDDLLDFSNGGIEDNFFEEEPEHDEDNKPCCVSVFPQEKDHKTCCVSVFPQEKDRQAEKDNNNSDPCRSSLSVKDDFESELTVPADDLANLEWLSHFVEDSFSGYSLTFPAGKVSENPMENRSETAIEPEIPASTKPCFTTPVQTKARSKRARTGGRVWSLGSPSLTESSSSSSSSSSLSSSTSSSPPSNLWLINTCPTQTAESFLGEQPTKKQKKKPAAEPTGGGPPQQARRCSHCLVQKTPQWRAGPLGAKTLCNACGVRYKSGRLLPEYRPACSPTFSSEVHSNNHRKVLEMRRKKELASDMAPSVQSF
ncbi:hypothetical protein F0562_003682 [Nyssa sinensis]|uniref:GATA-type domain-containing protein n=1 Tax=Nyssa sinensis TaxID=561372 RepID=A0A5J5BXT9_9ASTE|nr:hypothetical protein F0562_003682 [Nyssa sinensis]